MLSNSKRFNLQINTLKCYDQGSENQISIGIHLMTTTITISIPEETMAEYIGFPAVPDGSPSSLLRY